MVSNDCTLALHPAAPSRGKHGTHPTQGQAVPAGSAAGAGMHADQQPLQEVRQGLHPVAVVEAARQCSTASAWVDQVSAVQVRQVLVLPCGGRTGIGQRLAGHWAQLGLAGQVPAGRLGPVLHHDCSCVGGRRIPPPSPLCTLCPCSVHASMMWEVFRPAQCREVHEGSALHLSICKWKWEVCIVARLSGHRQSTHHITLLFIATRSPRSFEVGWRCQAGTNLPPRFQAGAYIQVILLGHAQQVAQSAGSEAGMDAREEALAASAGASAAAASGKDGAASTQGMGTWKLRFKVGLFTGLHSLKGSEVLQPEHQVKTIQIAHAGACTT